MKYLIIGRTVSAQGGYEFRWRDENGVLPNEQEKDSLKAEMAAAHFEVFKRNFERIGLAALPEFDDAKTSKLASWRDGAEAGKVGLHVIDDDPKEESDGE